MAKVQEISVEEFESIPKGGVISRTGKEAHEILKNLKANQPVLIENATKGLQIALTRRINKYFTDVEMRVEKVGDKRNIALLRRE